MVLLVMGSLVFLVLFRLAGLQGLIEYDAVMAWALKAKICISTPGVKLCNGFPIRG